MADPTRIKGFDGLRALAVLGVFLAHRSPLHGTHVGNAGVNVFFGLSGFLIVGLLHSARQRIEAAETSTGGELRRFFWHRSGRIFPIYYLALCVLAALALANVPIKGWDWSGFPWLLAYRANAWMATLPDWPGSISHLWSLSIEEWFYIFAAPALLLVPARRHALVCGLVVAAGLVRHGLLLEAHARAVAITTDSLLNYGSLALGGLLRLTNPRWAGRLLLPLAVVLGALALVEDTGAETYWLFVAPPLGALLVLAVAQRQDSWAVKALEWAPLAYLGRISYGFYLYHNLFYLWTPLQHAPGVLAAMALNFAASLALASLSWALIEKPILALVRGKRSPAASTTAAVASA